MTLQHIVALHFKPSVSESDIEKHFNEEARIKQRMPNLVLDWGWSKNISLADRADKNHGMNYIVIVHLADEAALAEYGPHPEHVALKQIQAPMLEDIVPIDLILPMMNLRAPLVHIVALRFKPSVSESDIEKHFNEEARIKQRMPNLVLDWGWSKNISLADRADKNHGMNYIVIVHLADEAALAEYGPHPEHVALKQIQAPMLEDIVPIDFVWPCPSQPPSRLRCVLLLALAAFLLRTGA